jgi:hypothetical protein
MVTPVVTVFRQGLSRSAAAAIELLGDGFAGTVVSDRFSAYNHLPLEQRQLCWAHLKRDLTAIEERTGASAEFGAQLLQRGNSCLSTGTSERLELPLRINPRSSSSSPSAAPIPHSRSTPCSSSPVQVATW